MTVDGHQWCPLNSIHIQWMLKLPQRVNGHQWYPLKYTEIHPHSADVHHVH
jgi:hypothetical protein